MTSGPRSSSGSRTSCNGTSGCSTRRSPHRAALAAALAALAGLGRPPSDALLDTYASAAELISEREVGSIDETDRAEAAQQAVVSTLLLEPVLLTMRRIAQENVSRRRAR